MSSFTVAPRVTDYFNRTVPAASDQSLSKTKEKKRLLIDSQFGIDDVPDYFGGRDIYNHADSQDPLRSPEAHTIKLQDMGNESLIESEEQRQSEECASPESGENFQNKKLKRKQHQLLASSQSGSCNNQRDNGYLSATNLGLLED